VLKEKNKLRGRVTNKERIVDIRRVVDMGSNYKIISIIIAEMTKGCHQ